MTFRSLAEISHPIFERVRVTREKARAVQNAENVILVGPTFEEVQGAAMCEMEQFNGNVFGIPEKTADGEWVVRGYVPMRNVDVAEPFREFLNSMSRGVGR